MPSVSEPSPSVPQSSSAVLFHLGEDGVATITLNQPDTRNALSEELMVGLIAALSRARDDPAARAIVLASSHHSVFSSGANLGGFAAESTLVQKHFASERFLELFKLIGALGKPTVCAAGGHVLAGALGIALACDLIVASEEATFGTPEIKVGTSSTETSLARRPTSCCCWESASARRTRLPRGSSTRSSPPPSSIRR
jgi:enoyl-CoA hydratase/carnithine racemase